MVDAALLLDAVQVAVATQQPGGASTLGIASLVDDSYAEIAPSNPGARVIVGRRGQVYQLLGRTLACYDITKEEPLVASLVLPATGADIAYDDAKDEVVVYAPALRTLYVCPETLPGYERVLMPASVPAAADGSVKVGPGSGLWVHPAGIAALYKVVVPPTGGPTVEVVSHASIGAAVGFDVDDSERVFVCTGGVLAEFMFDNDVRRWVPATDSPSGLNGTECDGSVLVARSRTNFDPDTMTGPAWRDTDPSDLVHVSFVPDCPGDLNADEVVSFADLIVLLGAWGPCAECRADIDGNGRVDFGDIIALLSAWGPCAD